MGTVITAVLGLMIGALVLYSVKKTIKNTKAGTCGGCPEDCTSGTCSTKVHLEE